MNVPPYLYSEDFIQSQPFFVEIFQSMLLALSNDGWTVPQVTNAQLLAIEPSMPNGTLWYVTDAVPPTPVMKLNGALFKLSSTAYP